MSAARFRILPALLVFILATALGRTDGLARDTDKSWEFGGFLMFSRYAGATGIDAGTGFGVRGGYHLKAVNELELSLDRVSADAADQPGVTFDVTKINFDFLRMFLVKGHEKMTPFAAFGIGNVEVDDGTESGRSTAYRAGGGFKYFFKPRAALRFDVKMYRWRGHGEAVPSDAFFSIDVQIGATFLVGGTK